MTEKYILWEEGEYSYPAAFGFVPNVHTYIHDDDEVRPALIVVPGGGYHVASPTEGEIVAKKFYEFGYQTFVCTYTTDLLNLAPLKDQPMKDLSRAIRFVRKNAQNFRVDAEKVFICGFSAGAHLCGSVAVHWLDIADENDAYKEISNTPSGVILSYPVITSGENAHRDSFVTLLGTDATEAELEYASLEKQVTAQTPPVFMWQTVTDQTVPVENSMLMAKALKDAGIFFEYHLFPQGAHGLSLSNDDWAQARFGEPYTMDQSKAVIDAVKDGSIPLPEETKQQLLSMFVYLDPDFVPDENTKQTPGTAIKEVAVWPDLANAWMKSL